MEHLGCGCSRRVGALSKFKLAGFEEMTDAACQHST